MVSFFFCPILSVCSSTCLLYVICSRIRPLFPTTLRSNALFSTLSLSFLKTCTYHRIPLALASPSKVSFKPSKLMLLAPFINRRNTTHCSYHCFFSSFQHCHLILPQTPCLAPIQHCQSYTTLVYPYFYLERKLFFIKQLLIFSKFYPSNSLSCCHRCFSSTTGIQPVLQVTKTFLKLDLVKKCYFFICFFVVKTHCSPTKLFDRIVVTLFVFAHLA